MTTTLAPVRTLPLPSFYESGNAALWGYRPRETELLSQAEAWKRRHGLTPSGADKVKLHLLLIDVQKDFCFPEGTLFVGGRNGRGAIEDNDRLAQFLYRNLGVITETTC